MKIRQYNIVKWKVTNTKYWVLPDSVYYGFKYREEIIVDPSIHQKLSTLLIPKEYA